MHDYSPFYGAASIVRSVLSNLRLSTCDGFLDSINQEILSVEPSSLESHLHAFKLEKPGLLFRGGHKLNLLGVTL